MRRYIINIGYNYESDQAIRLDTETIEGTAVALEGVDNVEGGDGLTLGVVGVLSSITNDAHEELTENVTDAVVNQERDTLHTTTAGETADSGLGDTLKVVACQLSVTLGTALAETFTTGSFSRHCSLLCCCSLYGGRAWGLYRLSHAWCWVM